MSLDESYQSESKLYYLDEMPNDVNEKATLLW